jgi:SAM-dependent methyltransferase
MPAVFRNDLFKGTAEYYDRYRPRYPPVLLEDLVARVGGRRSRMLDLACGTGQLAFPLAASFDEVVALDQEAELVEFGRVQAEQRGVDNIQWIVGTAETFPLEGAFDLVAIGNAFHRLDRPVVARRLVTRLADRGCIALVWSDGPMVGSQPWQQALDDTLERWRDELGVRDRAPAGWASAIERLPHRQVLSDAGLAYEGRFEFSAMQRWTVDALIGFVFSTSVLSRPTFGDQADAFAADVRAQLLALSPDDRFDQELTYAYDLARRQA